MYFSDLLQRTLRALGQLQTSVATSGSTTTVTDTKQAGTQGEDDAWKNGTLFIIRDAGGANAAPEGEFQRISAYDDSEGIFTVDTAFSISPASGDEYGFSNSVYNIYDLKQICNDALADLGMVPLVDTTTLDTEANKTEYSYAVTWKYRPPLAVDIQTQTDDSNDNLWAPQAYYRYVPATAGTAAMFELLPQPTASRDIRVWYLGHHTKLNAYSDVVNEFIFPELAVAACAFYVVDYQIGMQGGGDDSLESQYNKLADRLDRAKDKYPIWRPRKKQTILTIPWSK